MASVDWQKTNVPTLARKRSHFDNEKRKVTNHSNKDINTNLTNQNYYLNCEDLNDVLKKSREFIKEIDKKHPPKKKVKEDDRVTMVSLNIPCPRAITEMGKSEEFFELVNNLLESTFIGYIGMHVHLDEVHDYLDPRLNTIVTSLIHGHAWTCAYAEWVDSKGNKRQGINGKNFETKANILKLNKAMNDLCMEHFGIPYNTGDEPRNKSVEELKKESYKAVKKELVKTQRSNIKLTNENEVLLDEQQDLLSVNQQIRDDINKGQELLDDLNNRVNNANNTLNRVTKRIQEIIEKTDIDEVTYVAAINIIKQHNLQSELKNEIENLLDENDDFDDID